MANNVKHPELGSWLRKVEGLQQENVQLKNRVADIIRQGVNNSAVEDVEHFLNSFINKDAVFALLRYDITEVLRKLSSTADSGQKGQLAARSENLQKDILKMETEFHRLRDDFNNYILQLTPGV